MKMLYKLNLKVLALTVLILGCSDPKDELAPLPENNTTTEIEGVNAAGPGGGVMMQGFYWDVPAGGNWWNTVRSKIDAWANAGVISVWLPPVSKAQNGPFSMS